MAGAPAAHPGRALDAWARSVVGWHVAFWLLMGIAVVATVQLPQARRPVALVLLTVLAVAYAATVQRASLDEGRRGLAYLAVAIVVTGLLCATDPGLSLVLYIVYAQVWLFSGSLRAGITATVALSVSALGGFLVYHGPSVDQLQRTAPSMLVSLLFSLLLGLWISRIIDQSAERADLIAELEQARADLAAAERARGVADERERLAREIHDTLAQGFTSVVMLAQAAAPLVDRDPAKAARQLELIEDVARENLAEARALVAASAPAGLDGATLPDAVRRVADRFAQETGIEVDTDVAPVTRLDRDREVVVLRAVQEALSNVRRHARAGRVAVRLVEDAQGTVVEVGDDGEGFAADRRHAGYGLAGMRARVGEVGGELDVASTPGGGTRLTVRLPAVPA
jgi:signal transduction histidine kinase